MKILAVHEGELTDLVRTIEKDHDVDVAGDLHDAASMLGVPDEFSAHQHVRDSNASQRPIAGTAKYDAIITDYKVKKHNATSMLKDVRQYEGANQHTPAIVLSGSKDYKRLLRDVNRLDIAQEDLAYIVSTDWLEQEDAIRLVLDYLDTKNEMFLEDHQETLKNSRRILVVGEDDERYDGLRNDPLIRLEFSKNGKRGSNYDMVINGSKFFVQNPDNPKVALSYPIKNLTQAKEILYR